MRLFLVLLPLLLACSSEHASASGAGQDASERERAHDDPDVVPVSVAGVTPLHRSGTVLLGGQPTESGLAELARTGTTTIVDLRAPDEDRGFDEPAAAARLGLAYVSIPVPGKDGLTDAALDGVRRVVAEHRARVASDGEAHANERLLLHCKSSNRVGAVWAAVRALDDGLAWEEALAEARIAGSKSEALEEAARLYVVGAGKQGLGRIKETLRSKLPTVPVTTVSEVAGWIGEAETPLLVDARTPEEYAVSHLFGARNADSVDAIRALVDGDRTRPIVVYCSVGYRSGYLARDLLDAGFEDVKNLEGSIFEWANTGHPVYVGGARVEKVHPFDRHWGELLRGELWSELED